MFRRAVLASYSEDGLENLAHELERELTACKSGLAEKQEERQQQARDLSDSGIRFGAETALFVGGLIAAPATGGLSIIVTAGATGFLLWDGAKLARKAGGWRKTSRQADDLDERINEIEEILKGTAEELASRP